MPVRYMPMLPQAPKEFIEPIADRSFIFWLFRNRCIMCSQPATEINEIIPRSRNKKSILNWENRVTLCQGCHNEYHKNGVNAKTIENMQQKRKDFLMANGREEYANYVPLTVIVV
jgi:uncharacterized protein with PIN domain